MREHCCRTLAFPDPFDMLQVTFSEWFMFKGNLKASNVDAMPEEATAIAIPLSRLIVAKSKLITNVLPVPPGASRNMIPPFLR